MVYFFCWSTSYCTSYCQACIIQNRFQLIMKSGIISLVINDIDISNRILIKVLYTVKRDYLRKTCWNLRKRPRVLLIFFGNTLYMFREFNFTSNVKPTCFWNKLLLNGMLLNKRVGWSIFLIFLQNITSCAGLLKSGLKIIFHWKAQLVIRLRSWLKVVALVQMLFTTERRDLSSAKSLQLRKDH